MKAPDPTWVVPIAEASDIPVFFHFFQSAGFFYEPWFLHFQALLIGILEIWSQFGVSESLVYFSIILQN